MEEINMMNKNEMVEKLLEAKRQYYIEGTSFLSDSQFDALEEVFLNCWCEH
jgi:NAD-dependent DNA ligase